MKCDLCRNNIELTFLEKIKGTYVGRGKSKKVVCDECQKKHPFQEIRDKLK